MKMVSTVLTAKEREVLILSARRLTNTEIAERLGMSVINVKTLVHSACIKTGAHTRNAASVFMIMRGDIRLDEFCLPGELAEILNGLAPDVLRKVAEAVRLGAEHEIPRMIDKGVLYMDKRQDTILTKGEQNVLRFVGHGLTNKEIADKLFISAYRVRNMLNEAYSKLGARSRSDAFMLAIKQRDIRISEVFSPDEIVRCLAWLKPESLEKISQLLGEKLEQERFRGAG